MNKLPFFVFQAYVTGQYECIFDFFRHIRMASSVIQNQTLKENYVDSEFNNTQEGKFDSTYHERESFQ